MTNDEVIRTIGDLVQESYRTNKKLCEIQSELRIYHERNTLAVKDASEGLKLLHERIWLTDNVLKYKIFFLSAAATVGVDAVKGFISLFS